LKQLKHLRTLNLNPTVDVQMQVQAMLPKVELNAYDWEQRKLTDFK